MPYPVAAARGEFWRKPVVGSLTLPQNLITSAGTVLDACDATTDWAAAAGSIALDETIYRSGAALRATANTNGDARMRKTCSWSMYQNGGVLRVWVYLHAGCTAVRFLATSVSNFAKYFDVQRNVSAFWVVPGWNVINIAQDEWTNVGGESWANTIVRFDVYGYGTASADVLTFDSITDGVVTVPSVLFTFDDFFVSAYTNAYAYMQPKGILGTFYVETEEVDTAGDITSAQLATMQAGGWVIGNHTDSHPYLPTLDQATQQARIDAGRDALVGWGITGGTHVSYPFGEWDANTLLAMAAEGMVTGRTGTRYGGGVVLPADNIYLLPCRDVGGFTEAQNRAYLLGVKKRGEVAVLLMHNPEGADLQLMQNLVNYGISLEMAPLTIAQLLALQSGAQTVSVPW